VPGEPTVPLVIQLLRTLRDEAAKVAEEEERSLAGLIRVLLREHLDRRRAEHLTEREATVVQALAGGRSSPEITQQLGLSPEAVADQVRSILGKLGVHEEASQPRR
jgi:DNA-binding NarL/FixJ family response regulator